jgi:hypothetical protein
MNFKKIASFLASTFLAAMFFLPTAAEALPCPVNNIFVNGTVAQAGLVNQNFANSVTCASNIDNSNIGAAGIFASQIIPTNSSQATFGGSQNFLFPNNIIVTNAVVAGSASAPAYNSGDVVASENTSIGEIILGGTSASGTLYFDGTNFNLNHQLNVSLISATTQVYGLSLLFGPASTGARWSTGSGANILTAGSTQTNGGLVSNAANSAYIWSWDNVGNISALGFSAGANGFTTTGGPITSTNGNITATNGNVSAGGNVTAVGNVAATQNVTAGNIIQANSTVNSSSFASGVNGGQSVGFIGWNHSSGLGEVDVYTGNNPGAEAVIFGRWNGSSYSSLAEINQPSGTYTALSDISLKENIIPLIPSASLARIMALKPSTFDWKAGKVKDTGLIAQDVQKVIPDAVHPMGGKNDHLLGVSDHEVLTTALSALQAEEHQILHLQQEIDNLKAQLRNRK